MANKNIRIVDASEVGVRPLKQYSGGFGLKNTPEGTQVIYKYGVSGIGGEINYNVPIPGEIIDSICYREKTMLWSDDEFTNFVLLVKEPISEKLKLYFIKASYKTKQGSHFDETHCNSRCWYETEIIASDVVLHPGQLITFSTNDNGKKHFAFLGAQFVTDSDTIKGLKNIEIENITSDKTYLNDEIFWVRIKAVINGNTAIITCNLDENARVMDDFRIAFLNTDEDEVTAENLISYFDLGYILSEYDKMSLQKMLQILDYIVEYDVSHVINVAVAPDSHIAIFQNDEDAGKEWSLHCLFDSSGNASWKKVVELLERRKRNGNISSCAKRIIPCLKSTIKSTMMYEFEMQFKTNVFGSEKEYTANFTMILCDGNFDVKINSCTAPLELEKLENEDTIFWEFIRSAFSQGTIKCKRDDEIEKNEGINILTNALFSNANLLSNCSGTLKLCRSNRLENM